MHILKFLLYIRGNVGNVIGKSLNAYQANTLVGLRDGYLRFWPVTLDCLHCHFYVSGTKVATLVLFITIIPIVAIIGVILGNENNKIEMRLKNT